SALGAGVAPGAPAVDDDGGVGRDLHRRSLGDLAVMHVHGPGNATLCPRLVGAHIDDHEVCPRLSRRVHVARIGLVLQLGGEELVSVDHGHRVARRYRAYALMTSCRGACELVSSLVAPARTARTDAEGDGRTPRATDGRRG